ncbi:unnamed protein product [Macrosiphum euphorbiae]|uniref:Uncharacterized protein n=1 Tax=Macrosiphum euphorbiae TaxID=13131 RepID=A0AAV0WKJ7_9HEMI|nr:unnamed protein product [Macrosiphum euphorbiae]
MNKCGIHSIVHVTAPTIELAKSLARGLITKDLAACVNLIPNVTSIYKWKSEVNEDSEILMVIKTRTSRIGDLITYVESQHPYDVCEVISTKIENGNNSYMKYISECVPEASEN